MTVAKSTKSKKPGKPYSDFPLFAHNNGQWAKRIKGKLYCFGVWSDWKSALQKYQDEVHDLQLGKDPRRDVAADPNEITLKAGINQFLTVQEQEMEAGEMSPEHFSDLKRTLTGVVDVVNKNRAITSLTPADFRELKTKFGTKKDGQPTSPATLQGHIRRIKILFNWLFDEGLIDSKPTYGNKFGKLSKKQQQVLSNKADDKFMPAKDIRKMIDSCDGHSYRLKAMMLLAINCGMGPRDIAELTFSELDLVDGWLESERSKTLVRRCCKLWPETVAALNEVKDKRFEPKNKEHADLVFITKYGNSFHGKGAISQRFADQRKVAGVRQGSFYWLRHTCVDVLNQVDDDTARRWIVGHKRSKTEDGYIRTAPRERIEVAADHLHSWLHCC